MLGFGHLEPSARLRRSRRDIAFLAGSHGLHGACDPDSESKALPKPPGRVSSPDLPKASGRDIVHQRPPTRL
jgi:hypothetical protein